MEFHFDTPPSRLGTDCYKHDAKAFNNIPEDAIPLWVADMDFETAPCITEAIKKRAEHSIYGYTYMPVRYTEAVASWMLKRHNWEVDPNWIVQAPSIVSTFNLICQNFLTKGDYVLVQNPVYGPFKKSALQNGMHIANNPLRLVDGNFEIDFEDFEKQVSNPQVKLFILCNPHNPGGRVWTCGELRKMGELCVKHNVLIVSDEIHHDFVFPGSTFVSMGTVGEAIAQNLIVCTSPGKTFNLSAISCGNIIIPNAELREAFKTAVINIAFEDPSPFAVEATIAGYTQGESWLEALLEYLLENKVYVEQYIKEYIPSLQVIQSQATYLLWIDCRKLGLSQDELMHFMAHTCNLWVNPGTSFGDEGEGFIRLNLATPKANLERAMKQLQGGISFE